MRPLLDIDGLSISIPIAQGTLKAVRNISFTVAHGETLGVVGESGCGKSLTALAIMGLLPRQAKVTSRHFLFEGEDLSKVSEPRRASLRGDQMAMIFQEPMTALNPTLTIGLQLTEVLRRHRSVSWKEADERAVELLTRVGVSEPRARLLQYPHALSGGLRQRVMIAMALMCGPKLIVADEPTTALDVTIQAQILNLLSELKAERDMSMVFISHDLGVVSRIADRIIVMYAGEIVEVGTRAHVLGNPRHPYTRALLDCLPLPRSGNRGKKLAAIDGIVPSLVDDVFGCAFSTRCAFAVPACATARLSLLGQSDHATLCWRADEIGLGALA